MSPLQFFRTALLLGNIHLFQGCQANLDIRPSKKCNKVRTPRALGRGVGLLGRWEDSVTTD